MGDRGGEEEYSEEIGGSSMELVTITKAHTDTNADRDRKVDVAEGVSLQQTLRTWTRGGGCEGFLDAPQHQIQEKTREVDVG